MDPVTHAVLGRSLEDLRHQTPAETGTGLAVVPGALSPDIDVVLMPTGFDRYLVAHEAGTHSAIGAIVCGVLAAVLTRLIRRGSRFTVLVAAALVGAASHIVADLMAGALIRVGWPIAGARVMNLGAFAMGDPLIVILCVVTGIALARDRTHRRQWAAALVIAFLVGAGVEGWSRMRALDAYRALAAPVADGAVLIEPVSASLSEWRVFDRTAEVVRAWIADARGPVRPYWRSRASRLTTPLAPSSSNRDRGTPRGTSFAPTISRSPRSAATPCPAGGRSCGRTSATARPPRRARSGAAARSRRQGAATPGPSGEAAASALTPA